MPRCVPSMVLIEPTFGCNLRCRQCHHAELQSPPIFLDIDRIDFSFLRDLGLHVVIGQSSEPFIHPEIGKFFDMLIRHDVSFEFITNATLLNKVDIPDFSDAKLRQATFSFDGGTPETYENIRRNANFNEVVRNITNFVEKYEEKNTAFKVNCVMTREMEKEIPFIIDLWDAVGIDMISFLRFFPRDNDISNNPCESFDSMMQNANRYKMKTGKPTGVA